MKHITILWPTKTPKKICLLFFTSTDGKAWHEGQPKYALLNQIGLITRFLLIGDQPVVCFVGITKKEAQAAMAGIKEKLDKEKRQGRKVLADLKPESYFAYAGFRKPVFDGGK